MSWKVVDPLSYRDAVAPHRLPNASLKRDCRVGATDQK
jgi:hypothetical protein